jgi:hypothetical protein
MVSQVKIKAIIHYLTKLTHTVDAFRFKFINIEIGKVTRNMESYPKIQFDLEIVPKQEDIPYLWDFFHCKSKYIVQDACEMVGINWSDIFTKFNDIYYNGEISRYGGNIPVSFIKKISEQIQQIGPKQIKTHFFCGGERKILTLNVTYVFSDIYIDDGITTNVSVYCNQLLVDNEPLENIPQDLAETIVGYMTESDDLSIPLDSIVWDEVTKYMNLEDCEIWTHTYTHIRSIGDIEVDDYNYVNHSTFSSKLCDFISGDY